MTDRIIRFLADENCDQALVRALRSAGHDVAAVSELHRRSLDQEIIDTAWREKRILLTEDKDFGWLVFAGKKSSAGVIFIRFPGDARSAMITSVTELVEKEGQSLYGSFVVVQPGHIRISRHPR